ncbi:DUF4150 domain-containing protein [Chitinimonas viridis]|uniref:DUF4150 domain-containing protein n=1 Tax=Chitinimonas viridis TaxID=664880 RepID=A0ABT8B6S9_9NEIS|nr:PAAR-like domain-containing protein [Chitinimonas viridis]MDN3577729.1 DUF4150 domain-containing protein [Chitinimonas viridis]
MSHNVFANNNEICAKSASGSSNLATDTCFSPGAPMPGVPVPYMNSCKASDITKGSKTVAIKGMEVCMEDKSYFATSYGDEAATQGLKRGVVSTSVQGKCRFIGWSPNVFVEGLAVTRHLDMVTHNHNSPANTPPMHYMSNADPSNPCKKDYEQIAKRCAPDDHKDRAKRGKGVPKDKQGKVDKAGNWVMDHCGPLMVHPGDNFEDWKKDFGDLGSLMKKASDQLKNDVIAKMEKEIAEFAAKKLTKMAVRRGLTGWIPVVGWVLTAVDVAATGYEIATTVSTMKDELADLKKTVDNLKKESDNVTKAFKDYEDKLKKYGTMSADEKKKAEREVMAAVQGAYGAANPCLRARKCALVPYNKADKDNGWLGKGCCPGQTGHHLLPDAMFRSADKQEQAKAFETWKKSYGGKKDKSKLTASDMPRDHKANAKCWDKYKEGPAPTICLEGTDNTSGSHGLVHSATSTLLAPFKSSPTMDYTKARSLLAKEISVAYGCDADCLEAQLDEAYCKMYTCGGNKPCPEKLKDAKVVPHDGMPNGGPKTGDGTVNTDMDG